RITVNVLVRGIVAVGGQDSEPHPPTLAERTRDAACSGPRCAGRAPESRCRRFVFPYFTGSRGVCREMREIRYSSTRGGAGWDSAAAGARGGGVGRGRRAVALGGGLSWEGEAPAEPGAPARPEPRPPNLGHYLALRFVAPGLVTNSPDTRPFRT